MGVVTEICVKYPGGRTRNRGTDRLEVTVGHRTGFPRGHGDRKYLMPPPPATRTIPNARRELTD
jgi:hypothetical protein